jgi:hypothetical protein
MSGKPLLDSQKISNAENLILDSLLFLKKPFYRKFNSTTEIFVKLYPVLLSIVQRLQKLDKGPTNYLASFVVLLSMYYKTCSEMLNYSRKKFIYANSSYVYVSRFKKKKIFKLFHKKSLFKRNILYRS